MKERSVDAALVFMTLPLVASDVLRSAQSSREYMEYLDALVDGLPRVVLGLGSGEELVTGFA